MADTITGNTVGSRMADKINAIMIRYKYRLAGFFPAGPDCVGSSVFAMKAIKNLT
jgi:hypothetical protein